MEKMTISFWIWGMFDDGGIYHDLDAKMRELKERGFNTIRTESCAGLLRKPNGTPRGRIKIHRPFGDYGKIIRQMDILRRDIEFDAEESILRFFRAAKRNEVKIIISSWYFLHTNWFVDEEINNEIFELTTKEKFEYFTREYDFILTLLEENDLTDALAFYEIFNEFDNIYFAKDGGSDTVRELHEKSIEALKAKHPWAMAAYDISGSPMDEEIVPRNIDYLNFHCYYLWRLYDAFENGSVNSSCDEPEYKPETRQFLGKLITVKEIIKARPNNVRTGTDWNVRAALYNSIDPEKIPQLEKLLEASLEKDSGIFLEKLRVSIETIRKQRDKVVPGAKLVMGEGATYCYSNKLLFEEHSDLYWEILKKQAELLNKANFVGTVVRTISGPEDPSWEMRKESYKEINKIFLDMDITDY